MTNTEGVTIREIKRVPYTTYRNEVVESQARLVGKIEAIKEVLLASKQPTNGGYPGSNLGLGHSKAIVDALERAGYRLVKVEE